MAQPNFRIKSDLPKAQNWAATMAKQLPFATAGALNSTAFDARTSLSGATRQYFDRPTTFTQNGFQVDKATKRTLQAIVGAERKRGRYLRTQISGGGRGVKPFEERFGGGRLVPTNANRKNQYGNVSKAAITKLGAGTTGTGKGSVLVGTPRGGGRPFGVYERQGRNGGDRLVPKFVRASPSYRRRFPILDVVGKVIQRRYEGYLRSSLSKALATAR